MINSNKEAFLSDGRSHWMILAILSSTLLAVMFAETMLLPAIPDIMKEFHMDYNISPWIFSSYLIVAAVMTPISGRLSDIFGKKKILLILLVVYIAGLFAGGFSNNTYYLIIARIVQGVGLSSVPVAFGIVRDVFPAEKLAIAIGIFGSAYSGGSVIGLLAGATIIQNLGWHLTFFVIAPLAIIVTVLISKFIHTKPSITLYSLSKELFNSLKNKIIQKEKKVIRFKESNNIDVKGAITLSATIIFFLIGLTLLESGSKGITYEIQIPSLFVISLVSLIMFIIIEKKSASPLVDLKLIKHRILLPCFMILMPIGISMFLVYPTITQLVRSPPPFGFGGDAITVANIQLPFMIVFLIVSTSSAFIISRFGSLKPLILGSIIAIIGSIGLVIYHYTELYVSLNLGILATGMALANTGGWNILVTSAPQESVGISVGIGALLFFIGMAIGPAIAGLYMQSHQIILKDVHLVSYPSTESYNLIFLTAMLSLIIPNIFSIILRNRLPKFIQQQTSLMKKPASYPEKKNRKE